MSAISVEHITEKLHSQGWYLSSEGINQITQNGSLKDIRTIIQVALDSDFKEIGKPILAEKLASKCIDNVVLQIQKVRNISAPKANEESQAAPRMLKLNLTDGHAHCQAIEIDNIRELSLSKTAPGTKLLLKNAAVINGFVFINPSFTIILGGKVPSLYEKWEVNRTMTTNFKRGDSTDDGPPSWVNFGKKISGSETRDFKSLEDKSKDANGKPTDFDLQRNVAIEAAASGAIKKVFGGGTKPLINESNKYEGYKREPREFKERESKERNSKFERRNKREPKEKSDATIAKPSEKVSLFAFLEDKLPETPVQVQPQTQHTSTNSSMYPQTSNKSLLEKNNKFSSNYKVYDGNKFSDHKTNYYNKSNDIKFNDSKPKEYNKTNDFNKANNYQNRRQTNQPPRLQNKQSNQNQASQQNVDDITQRMDHLNVNASFAKNAFKQHLNLPNQQSIRSYNDFGGPNQFHKPQQSNDYHSKTSGKLSNFNGDVTTTNNSGSWHWQVGDLCMAKYWEDNKYYNATITGLTAKTCVVKFNDYGNMEEVLIEDCLPISPEESDTRKPQKYSNGTNEYRGNRNFVNRNYRRY